MLWYAFGTKESVRNAYIAKFTVGTYLAQKIPVRVRYSYGSGDNNWVYCYEQEYQQLLWSWLALLITIKLWICEYVAKTTNLCVYSKEFLERSFVIIIGTGASSQRVFCCLGMQFNFAVRFGKQFHALSYKHVLVAYRNWRATTLRALAAFLFLFLVFILDLAIQADNSNSTQFKSIRDPKAEVVNNIPRCEDDFFYSSERGECYELYFTPNTSQVAKQIFDDIRLNNDPLIEEGMYLSFASKDEADDWLLENPERVQGGIHFKMDNYTDPTYIDFIVQFNTTVKFFKGNFQNPQKFIQLPLQLATHKALSKYVLNESSTVRFNQYEVSYAPFAHPQIETFSIVGQISSTFLFAANMFGFVALLSNIIMDKEIGLKTAMRTMGMLDSSYWLTWFAYEAGFTFISSLLMVIFGMIFQFDMFLNNDFGLLLILFWLFQLAMSSLAMMISPFLRKAAIAVYLGFAIFVVGWIMQIVVSTDYPFVPKYYKSTNGIVTAIFALCPWSLFAKGISDLGEATSTSEAPGISWNEQYSYCKNLNDKERESYVTNKDTYVDLECVFSLGQIYLIFLGEWVVYFLLAVYLDNVIPNENGVRRAPWYFLLPSYWNGDITCCQKSELKKPLQRQNSFDTNGNISLQNDTDVVAEEERMINFRERREVLESSGQSVSLSKDLAVEIYGLQKRFGKNFWAVKGTWFGIQHNQLFCLLGPNGAGKTTTINCLTGNIPTSGGDAVICGQRLSSAGGLDRIRSIIGVCPQFDTLYHELTGKEHLWIYGQIKGISNKDINVQVTKLLEQVKLLYAGGQRTGSYSGGMRRRLSVAIALLGNPQVVFLDEPTTGMDPIARRYVWDIIQDAKKGRAIILTTHSMEEADILGDVVGIMARGRLRCLGSSLRLKQKFGTGYLLGISVVPPKSKSGTNLSSLQTQANNVKQFFQQKLNLEAVSEDKAYIHFVIPKTKESELPNLLAELEDRKQELSISDVQLSLTTLQDVFLKIAREVEIQQARLTGASVIIQLPGGQQVKVASGQEIINLPNGENYQAKWTQDEAGNLVVVEVVSLAATPQPPLPPVNNS